MLLNLLEYHWAEHVDDALLLLSRPGMKTVPLAGGTYLLGVRDDSIQAVVDLRDLELAYITEDARGIHIGAMTTLQTMVDSPLLKELAFGILARAALASSSSRLIRNSATLGGTLGAGVASQADLLTALAVMDAQVLLRSGSQTQVDLRGGATGLSLSGVTYRGKQERRIPFTTLFLDRRPHELIMEVMLLRPTAGMGTSFMRIARTPTDVALLNAAAFVQIIDGTTYGKVRLALGGVNMEPVRLQTVEKMLEGQPVDGQRVRAALQAGMAGFQPPSDFRASSSYRRVCGMNLAYRVLEEASSASRWHGMVSSGGNA